jgi:hypothetical protein
MNDYTWPSIYLAYLFFAICFLAAVFFFARSWKDGYWNKRGEDIKYQVFDDSEQRDGAPAAPEAREHAHVAR